jgi:hypothetical protein
MKKFNIITISSILAVIVGTSYFILTSEKNDASDTKTNNETISESVFNVGNYTGSYKYYLSEDEAVTSTSTELRTIDIQVEINDQGRISGTFGDTFHSESTVIPDKVDSLEQYSFSGEFFDSSETTLTLDTTASTDNNTVEPLHREYQYTTTITFRLENEKFFMDISRVSKDTGVTSTDEYILEKV